MSVRHSNGQIIGVCIFFSALFHVLTFLFLTAAPRVGVPNMAEVVAVDWSFDAKKNSVVRELTWVNIDVLAISVPHNAAKTPIKPKSPVVKVGARALESPLPPSSAPIDALPQVTALHHLPGILFDAMDTVPDFFYRAAELDLRAEMLLPMELAWFEEQFSLSGSLKMELYVRADGKVDRIELLNVVDVSGALRETLLPLLQSAKFVPATKNGQSVNSIKVMEFDLAARIDPKTYTAVTLPGFRPKLDVKGNIAPNQDLSKMP